MPIKLAKRRDMMDGYILAPTGATVEDAVCSADISIPQYRQSLAKDGNLVLSQHNDNERCRDLELRPPSIETCAHVLEVIAGRKEPELNRLRAELAEMEAELKMRDLPRGERSYFTGRKKGLEAKIMAIATEAVTAQELQMAFIREDTAMRSMMVPAEMREALQTLQMERTLDIQSA